MTINVINSLDTLNTGRIKINNNFDELDGEITVVSGNLTTLDTRVTVVEDLVQENETVHEHFAPEDRVEVGAYCYWSGIGAVALGKTIDIGSVQLFVNGLSMHSNEDQVTGDSIDFWATDTRIYLLNSSGLYGIDIEATDIIEAFYQTN